MDKGHLEYALHDADKAKRVPVTAKWYWNNLVEHNATCWLWNADAKDCGLDPWIEIDGIDPMVNSPTWVFESVSGKEHYGTENTILFVQTRDLERYQLGAPEVAI